MNTIMTPAMPDTMEAVYYRPAVSIIMPFEPKMSSKRVLAQSLETAADKVERDILEHYSGEMGTLVIQKLRTIINGLNYNTYKNSIAVYVSPVFEKVLYLNFPVQTKVIVDESFAIRDLVCSKKQMRQYLVLFISNRESRIYTGDSDKLARIVTNSCEFATPCVNGVAQRVTSFPDIADQKEIIRDKFLQRVDNSLNILLNAYPFPLFVLASEKIMGHFKRLTKHTDAIIDYVPVNFEEASVEQVKNAMKPLLDDWQKVRQKDILNQLDRAAGKKKLAIGIRNVWREAINRTGRLLVIEKNYQGIVQQGCSEEIIHKAINPYYTFSYIRDVVDDVIEKVLENGGDVEFIEKGLLKNYGQIALIPNY